MALGVSQETIALFEAELYDPVAQAPVALRLANADSPEIFPLDGGQWQPHLLAVGSIAADGFAPGYPGWGEDFEVQLVLDMGHLPHIARYDWPDRPARLYLGKAGDAWPWPVRFSGLVASVQARAGLLTVALRADDAWVDRPILSAFYAGTTGIEGPAELKGVPKPLALGQPHYAEPVLINVADQIYQYSAYGATEGVAAVLDRLVRYPASAGDYPDYLALLSAAVVPGQYATCAALGLLRLGAPPVGPLTIIAGGDKAGPDGWARKPGQIIARIAELAGAKAHQIDAANLAALDAAIPHTMSLYIRQQMTARQLIGDIAASCNAMAMIAPDGRLKLVRGGLAAPAAEAATDGTAALQVTDADLAETGAPWHRLQMAAEPCFRPHGYGEIAYTAELIELGPYDPGTQYREGNIVEHRGARWLYINPQPTKGHAPPDAGNSNDWWQLLSGAPSWSDIVDDGGKPESGATRNAWRGDWEADEDYLPGDMVRYQGRTFVATEASRNKAPPTSASDNDWWDLVTDKGEKGDPGSASPGSDPIILAISRSAATVITAQDGSGGDYAHARGKASLREGGTDITSSASWSVGTTDCTGGIDASGNYFVSSMSADVATLSIIAVWGGVTYTADFSVTRFKSGHPVVTSLPTTGNWIGRIVYLDAGPDSGQYEYRDGDPPGWSNRITASRIDQLDIGGANLVHNSSFAEPITDLGMRGGWGLYNNGGTGGGFVYTDSAGTSRNVFGPEAVRVRAGPVPGSTLGVLGRRAVIGKWRTGVWYAISFYMRKGGANHAGITGAQPAWSSGPQTRVTIANPTPTSEFQRYAYRVKWDVGAPTPGVGEDGTLWLTATGSWGEGAEVRFDDIQVEEGEVSTAYGPRITELLSESIVTNMLASYSVIGNKVAFNTLTGQHAQLQSIGANVLVIDGFQFSVSPDNKLIIRNNGVDTDLFALGAIGEYQRYFGTGFQNLNQSAITTVSLAVGGAAQLTVTNTHPTDAFWADLSTFLHLTTNDKNRYQFYLFDGATQVDMVPVSPGVDGPNEHPVNWRPQLIAANSSKTFTVRYRYSGGGSGSGISINRCDFRAVLRKWK